MNNGRIQTAIHQQTRKLAARCPACRRPPRLRCWHDEPARLAAVRPDKPVLTYQCVCGEVYILRASAWQAGDVPAGTVRVCGVPAES